MTRLSPAERAKMRAEHAYVPPMGSTFAARCRKGHLWPCDVVQALDHLDDVDPAESTVEIGGVRMTQSQFDAARRPLLDAPHAEIVDLLCNDPHLGMASTRELLAEITARIDVDHASGGSGLDYRTVDEPSPPDPRLRMDRTRELLDEITDRTVDEPSPPPNVEAATAAVHDWRATGPLANDPEPDDAVDPAIQDWVARNLAPLWTVRAHIMRATGEETEWVIPETVARDLKIGPGAIYRGDPIVIEDRVEAIVRVRR